MTPLRRPTVCLVTDRRRLPATRSGDAAACDALVALAGAAGAAGVDIVQVRERGLGDRALLRLVERIVRAVEGRVTRVVVNDRTDVALAAGAGGVHLKDGGPAPARVRAIAPPGWLVGQSVHRLDDARRAEQGGGLDYLVCGPVFETASKPGQPPLGVERFEAVVRACDLPVLAIGGVDPSRAAPLAAAGAAGAAAIGCFAEAAARGRPDGAAPALAALRAAFDKGWGLL